MRRTGDDKDPLLKEIEPIVCRIWAEGINQGIERWTCIWMNTGSILMEPLGLIMLVIKKIVPLSLLVVVYGFFHEEGNKYYPYLSELLIALCAVFFFWKDIQETVVNVLIRVVTIVSAGKFLQWLGKGYIKDSVLFNNFLSSSRGKALVALNVGCLPIPYRRRCDHIMDLYLDIRFNHF